MNECARECVRAFVHLQRQMARLHMRSLNCTLLKYGQDVFRVQEIEILLHGLMDMLLTRQELHSLTL